MPSASFTKAKPIINTTATASSSDSSSEDDYAKPFPPTSHTGCDKAEESIDSTSFGNEIKAEESPSLYNCKENEFTFHANGIPIKFPFEPYPSQKSMVESMIRVFAQPGNERGLLESPTGSGKSMAILCGALAWLEHLKCKGPADISKQALNAKEGKITSCNQALVTKVDNYEITDAAAPVDCNISKQLDMKTGNEAAEAIDSDADDFVSLRGILLNQDPNCKNAAFPIESINSSLPRIYIASRTHKQLAQLIKELKRTTYRPRFIVLGSRTHYCINSEVKKAKDINEACNDALKTCDCLFARKVQSELKKPCSQAKHFSMDIEELVKYGKSNRLCPYYLSRDAARSAEVVFTPYNYLVDPVIRQAMGINLAGSIVIIDEAHNIEDSCREAGSFEISLDSLQAINQELGVILHESLQAGNQVVDAEAHRVLSHAVSVWYNWAMNRPSKTQTQPSNSFETAYDIWKDQEIKEELKNLGIISSSVSHWISKLDGLASKTTEIMTKGLTFKRSSNNGEQNERILSTGSIRTLQGLFNAINNVMDEAEKYLDSFRLVRSSAVKLQPSGQRKVQVTLGFWCLSPEVVFSPIASLTKSIILTSGTLSPMDTFASELKSNFSERLEAMHIVDRSQVWVGVLPNGPSGFSFLGNYKTMESFRFQDELAQALLSIIRIVPFGVLCFLPSYGFMDKLLDRMRKTGVYKEMSSIKTIMVEPKQGSAKEFDLYMNKYYQCIRKVKSQNPTGMPTPDQVTGVLMFAVYRGKVSEGLDLADENARAVIPVGIPYPSYLDQRVVQKREYNDKFSMQKKLLNGHQWYETQAFRALNQALGRCIRHRHDWGAIILLEQRFMTHRYHNHLSKWVRSGVQVIGKFEQGIESLRSFIEQNAHSSP